ncbi:glycosyltransferase [Cellulomonas wangsupingiae]|uniref:Glycosyltransferase family 2 protein n=1 Tax=Cellulomonas wangsupingiae TaxID=2968085 RepID=A0ABY5KAA8_9CELL|nr:glycosyltransferase family 2 protein [Cellulomonas wangsupingiae]MCC2334338.1 glycosyltransferase family 2 protein [Cellulomonas wangsupingiae]UUI66010.1 glycosyltransferase family 2 protein [Cellulomonas wangsupingiae]
MPVDAVVVVNHASHELLARHLAATVTGTDLLVVVVDNSPRPQDTAAAAGLCASRGWLHVPVPNEGFGAGVDAGLREAAAHGAQAVLVLNPDLAVTPDAALGLLATARERDALVAPRVDRPDGRPWFTSGTLDERAGTTRAVGDRARVDWLSGACLAATTSTWSRLGGFDPRYFLYWEDVDLGRRATRAGVPLVVREDVTAVHDVGGTQSTAGSRRKSDTYYRENCRGRLVFAAHHLDARLRARWVLGAPGYAWAVVLRGGRRQLLRGPRPVLAAIGGTLAGAWYARRSRPVWPPAGSAPLVPAVGAADAA